MTHSAEVNMSKPDTPHLHVGHSVETITPLDLRVTELMHHMRIESAIAEGAKNVVRQLSGSKVQDRRILAEVGTIGEHYNGKFC